MSGIFASSSAGTSGISIICGNLCINNVSYILYKVLMNSNYTGQKSASNSITECIRNILFVHIVK